GVGVLARRNAHDAFENPLEVKWAESRLRAQRVQRERIFQVRLDVATGGADDLDVRGGRVRLAGAAAPARTIPAPVAGRRAWMESHLPSPRPPRRARRPTVNARRTHGIDETAVPGGVALLDGPPTALLVGHPRARPWRLSLAHNRHLHQAG